jgi:hypothetical protein
MDRQERDQARLHLLSGVLRHASDGGGRIRVSSDNRDELIHAAPPRPAVLELADRLLALAAARVDRIDAAAVLNSSDCSLLYLRDGDELAFVLTYLAERRLIAPPGTPVRLPDGTQFITRLTGAGWQRADELRRSGVRSRQAFVAMAFSRDVTNAFTVGILPACSATGYDALRMDQVQHNEKIDDRIVAEIRRSGLVIADFTYHRGGVYFEAGFALGIGLPVIWTCREDHLAGAHFDTRQYNYIAWSDPVQLRDLLVNRIRATVPGAQLAAPVRSA